MARRRRRNGAAFKYTAGDSLAVATFSRASSASYIGSNGVLQTASSGVARDNHYINGVRTLLLEGQRTNSFLNSGTPATHTSPSLGTGSFTLWMVGTGSIAVAGATATITGAGTATAGTPVTFTVTVAGTVTFTVTGSPTRAQCENGPFASSYIATAGSAVTRSADSLVFPFGYTPQALTVFFKCVDLGTASLGNLYFEVGSSGADSNAMGVSGGASSHPSGFYCNGGTCTNSALASVTVAVNDVIEGRLALSAAGVTTLGVSQNGGAEATVGSSAVGLGAGFAAPILAVNQRNAAGTLTGFAAFQSLKIALGVQSLATMRGL